MTMTKISSRKTSYTQGHGSLKTLLKKAVRFGLWGCNFQDRAEGPNNERRSRCSAATKRRQTKRLKCRCHSPPSRNEC